MEIKLRDCYEGQKTWTLDQTIKRLQEIRKRASGETPVTLYMEPSFNGEIVQLEDSLCDIAAATVANPESERGKITSVHFLGRSFD